MKPEVPVGLPDRIANRPVPGESFFRGWGGLSYRSVTVVSENVKKYVSLSKAYCSGPVLSEDSLVVYNFLSQLGIW